MTEEPRVDMTLNVRGKVCPVPLIETRRAVDKMDRGKILKILGAEKSSKREILMAIDELGTELIRVYDEDGGWGIIIRKR